MGRFSPKAGGIMINTMSSSDPTKMDSTHHFIAALATGSRPLANH